MSLLYHSVPEDMWGNTLYPLNSLREYSPQLFQKKSAKYEGREFVMKDIIPILNCKWNDVLHLSPVHPAKIKAIFREAGKETLPWKYFEIDSVALQPEQTVIYLYRDLDRSKKFEEGNFIAYNPALVASYNSVPEAARKYLLGELTQNKRPLIYAGIPHVLYRGNINTEGLPIVEV